MKQLVALLVFAPALVRADTPKAPTPAKPVAGAPAMPPVPPKAPEPPKPGPEMAEYGGGVTGTRKCTGKVIMGGSEVPATATVTNKLDLGQFWVQTAFKSKLGATAFNFTAYTSYNAAEKKFYRVALNNLGGYETSSSIGVDHGMADKWAMHWDGAAHAAELAGHPTNVVKTRQMEVYSRAGVEMSGEESADGGKTWSTSYSLTCKK
ncbi:MAG TPA: hypothetical protein VGM39_13385 [Kofleriaceae bacterium]|jgi:hypothetical protein